MAGKDELAGLSIETQDLFCHFKDGFLGNVDPVEMYLSDDIVFFGNEILQFLRSRVGIEDEMSKVHELLTHQCLNIFLPLFSFDLFSLCLRKSLGFLLLYLYFLLFVETQLDLFLEIGLDVEIINVVIEQTGYLVCGFFVQGINVFGHADVVLVV